MMMRARAGAVAVLLAVTAGAVAGCVAPASGPAGTPTPTDATTSTESAQPQGTAVPATPPQDAAPATDPNAATNAVAAAVAAVTAYCRPSVSKGEWLATLTPLLTDSAAVAYGTVDPDTVPCKTYTGNATVRDGDDAYVFRVNVPTDAGVYEAYVSRPTTSAPWKVERMTPPE